MPSVMMKTAPFSKTAFVPMPNVIAPSSSASPMNHDLLITTPADGPR